ncbi:MAG: hypothetical protein JKY31_13370 [Rhodobacteraceae bacterium]|nr:hypothetical protein [Paracoccaceae bacterium]
MIDKDVTEINKVISKTESHLPEHLVYRIAALPELRERFLAIPPERRTGPVIVTKRSQLRSNKKD